MNYRAVLSLMLLAMLFVTPALGQTSSTDNLFRNVIEPILPAQIELLKIAVKGSMDEYYLMNGYNSYKDAESYYNSGNYELALPAINNSIEYVEKVKSFIFKNVLINYYYKVLSDTYSMKGATLNELNQYNEALIYLNKSTDLNNKNAYAWNNKGDTFYHLGNYGEAIKCYDNAIAIDPSLSYAAYSKKCLVELKLRNESVGLGEDLRCKCMRLKTKYIDTPYGPQPICVAEGSSNLGTNGSMGIGFGGPGTIAIGNDSNPNGKWRNSSSGFTYP